MILFNIEETAVSIEWDEVCGIPTLKYHELIRDAIKSTMNNSSWNISRITSDNTTHHIIIKWESKGGHSGLSVISVDEENAINAFRNELSRKYNDTTANVIIEDMVIEG